MNKIEVRCPNCQTNFLIGSGGNAVTELSEGIHYLVPETIRNENVSKAGADVRMAALKAAGLNVNKLQTLMQNNDNLKDLFDENDPILTELKEGGFLHNPELFRRWITAQTFRLLKDPNGWTHAVRRRYDTHYVFRQTKRELALLCKLYKKCPNDIRFQFFTLNDLKKIFCELEKYNFIHNTLEIKEHVKNRINGCFSYEQLYDVINGFVFAFRYRDCRFIPRTWLNCFKGAGAYYTLQNIIRTHGLVLPNCENMNESLKEVEGLFGEICKYPYYNRRWDLMLSLLTRAIAETHFELKW